ncbi:hypothetical protein [Streptomyces sp. NPDC056387]
MPVRHGSLRATYLPRACLSLSRTQGNSDSVDEVRFTDIEHLEFDL